MTYCIGSDVGELNEERRNLRRGYGIAFDVVCGPQELLKVGHDAT